MENKLIRPLTLRQGFMALSCWWSHSFTYALASQVLLRLKGTKWSLLRRRDYKLRYPRDSESHALYALGHVIPGKASDWPTKCR